MKERLLFDGTKEDGWVVYNKKEEMLGRIYYWHNWRCFIWEQDEEILMSRDCLQQIVNFIKDLETKKLSDLK